MLGKNGMLLVIDTNIIVSAIKSGIKKDKKDNYVYSKAYRLMADVFNGKHRMFVSKEINSLSLMLYG